MAAGLQQLPRLILALLAAAALPAVAQDAALSGRMGDRALIVVGGQPYTLAAGQSGGGVKLRRWVGDDAEVESGGKVSLLRMGASPVHMGGAAPRAGSGREIVLTAGPGGHFTTLGAINGRPVQFLVDTGATLISMGMADAQRLGIDLSNARRGATQTANGAVPVMMVTLSSVRVGDVELANVGAVVMPQNLPVILLGNSFLSRLQMKRENDVMRLELR